jgi:hypothetical protein
MIGITGIPRLQGNPARRAWHNVLRRNVRTHLKLVVTVVAGIVIAAYVSLGASIVNERSAQQALTDEIAMNLAIAATSASIPAREQALIEQLRGNRAALAAADAALPIAFDSQTVTRHLLTLADDTRLRTVNLDMPDPVGVVNEDGTGRVTPVYMEVQGTVEDMIAFFALIENDLIGPTMRPAEITLQETPEGYHLGVEILVYSRVGGATSGEGR